MHRLADAQAKLVQRNRMRRIKLHPPSRAANQIDGLGKSEDRLCSPSTGIPEEVWGGG